MIICKCNTYRKGGLHLNKVRKILLNILVTLLIYFLIYYLSHIFFLDYLFVWTANYKYCYIWALSFLLILVQKPVISYCITLGNVLGIFIGQYLGDYLRAVSMSKITQYSTPEERWHLSLHYGVLIWIIVIVLLSAIGLLYTIYTKNKSRHLGDI